MLLLGRCGVLIVDMASVPTHSGPLIERIHAQFPDVVVVVAGGRDDEAALAGLVSDGLIYRYMHKPLSAKRAGMFLNAAIQQYVERRGRARLRTIAAAHGTSARARSCALLGDPGRRDRRGRARRRTALTTTNPPHRCSHRRSRRNQMRSQRHRAPIPVLSRARAALAAGRYEAPEGRNALDLYRAVLLAKPEHAEARAGLERAIEAIVADAQQHWHDGDRAEAERLLHRVLEAEPAQPAAQALLASYATGCRRRDMPRVVEDTPPVDEAVAIATAAATAPTSWLRRHPSRRCPTRSRGRSSEASTAGSWSQRRQARTGRRAVPVAAAKPAPTTAGTAAPVEVRRHRRSRQRRHATRCRIRGDEPSGSKHAARCASEAASVTAAPATVKGCRAATASTQHREAATPQRQPFNHRRKPVRPCPCPIRCSRSSR